MRKWLLPGLALAMMVFPTRDALHAQMTDAQKRQLFLQAREDIRPVAKPSPSATPRPRPQAASTPRSTPKPAPAATPKPTPEATPKPEPTPESTPKPQATPDKREKPEPSAKKEEPAPAATPKPTPPQIPSGKTPAGTALDAPIIIEKDGLIADEGEQPPARSTGGWFRRWRYLSPAVRKAIDQARVKKGRWKYIIIHNSGTRQGNARAFDNYHRKVRKMQNGLAYHFVIGNGHSSGDGEIEIGPRWTKQINGGHVASDYLNNIALGICLVGDLNRDKPTPAQLAAIDELVTYLRGRVGKIKGKPTIVKGHKEINPKPTDCPGDRFPLKWLHQKFD